MNGWLHRLLMRRRARRIEREDVWYVACELCGHPIIRHDIVPDGPPVCTIKGCRCGKELPR